MITDLRWIPACLVLGCASTPANQDATPSDAAASPSTPAQVHGHHGERAEHGNDHQGHRQHGIHHSFEDADKWAKVFDSPERAAWQKPDEIVAALKLPANAVVADIGAGTGYFAVRFARVVGDGTVVASDIEPDMVRYLGERAHKEQLSNLVAIQGTAADPKLDRDVDVAFLCDVYHHVADRPAFFAAIVKRLRPGGRVVIVDFDPQAPEDAPGPPKAMRVSPQTVRDELGAVGLVQSSLEMDLLPYQYVLELKLSPGS